MLTVDAKKLVAKLKAAARVLDRGIDEAVERTAQESRERIVTRYWKNRTGYTLARTSVERLGHGQRRVVVAVPWAAYLDQGTRPHAIRPRSAKALGPMRGGRFYARVNHPGTRGFYFSRKEAERARPLLAKRCAAVVNRAFKLAVRKAMTESNAAISPAERCGCAHPGWFHEGPPCDLPKGHRGHHESPNAAGPMRRFEWADPSLHLQPCGCRACSPGSPPDLATVERVKALAGPGATVDELIKGGFGVCVPLKGSAVRYLAFAVSVGALEAALRKGAP